MVKAVTRYESEDGQTHSSHVDAQAHELAVRIHKELGSNDTPPSKRIQGSAFPQTVLIAKWVIVNLKPELPSD